MGILFRKCTDLFFKAYMDADYVGSMVVKKSTSGYCTFLEGNLVTWKSKKQTIVARSSAKAKFRVMT